VPTHNLTAPAPGATAPVGALVPGVVTPARPVPAAIPRPEYVGRAEPDEGRGGNVYTPEEIELIREAGRIAARALQEAGRAAVPGTTTDELDRIAHEYLCDHGAYPSCLGYRGFPKSICTSLNEVICHGIPDSTVLEEGDIVNLDVTAYKNGFHGDTNRMVLVGEVDEQSRLLVERTEEALNRAVKAVRPGREINVIGRVIEKYARRFDYGVVRDFTGHGVGREFHSGLIVPHYDAAPSYSTLMVPGMVFTIEPMLTLGTIQWEQWDDDWTVTTRDRRRTAQFEHTMAVTEDGVDVLTLP
jgi:methionyl aminopeptidase